jgi:hypothetical protein
MKLFRTISMVAVAAAMLGGTLVAPASAQQGGGNQGGGHNQGCTQTTGGNQRGGNDNRQGGRPAGDQLVAGVIAAAVQNVTADVSVLNGANALNNPNLQVVCLNNALNNNQIQLLSNILNNSPILSQNQNNLNNLARNANIALLNNVQVVSVNLLTGQVFALRQQ